MLSVNESNLRIEESGGGRDKMNISASKIFIVVLSDYNLKLEYILTTISFGGSVKMTLPSHFVRLLCQYGLSGYHPVLI